jgi:hypothetical protein
MASVVQSQCPDHKSRRVIKTMFWKSDVFLQFFGFSKGETIWGNDKNDFE